VISVYTPTNNSSRLMAAYASLKAQTYEDWEWIVAYNNGAQKVYFDDCRVKEYELDIDDRIGALKAATCRYANGDILFELDHDDLLLPTALEEAVDAFKTPDVGFVYSNSVRVDTDWKNIEDFQPNYGWKYRKVEYQNRQLDELIAFDADPTSVSRIWFAPDHFRAVRRGVYERVGGHDESLKVLDDLDLMCKLYLETKFHHVDKGLYVYRIHGDNAWLRFNDEIQAGVYPIYDKYIEQLAAKKAELDNTAVVNLSLYQFKGKRVPMISIKGDNVVSEPGSRWLFEDNSIGLFIARDSLEHLTDPLHSMSELYRVMAPGAIAIIRVPSTDGRGAFQDPTYKSYWNQNSFLYYTTKPFADMVGFDGRFQAIRLCTTEKDELGVCWTHAHLVCLKGDYRPPGLIFI
jgi:glycosyltransferase involved in cell wall biosynthesis